MIFQMPVQGKSSNCYILSCDASKKAVIIDPGSGSDAIMTTLMKEHLDPELIILTHGHHDHIGAVEKLRKELQIKVAVHKKDAEMLINPIKNRSQFWGTNITLSPAEICLEDNQKIVIGNMEISVIHTPGHTPGSISLLTDQGLFSGDTLFDGQVGKTDLPGGSIDDLLSSIHNKLLVLKDDVKVYPGHGGSTTIGNERSANPYIRYELWKGEISW
ncbi:MAG: MBL fold metallo-hydrolase [Peptococcaceae bacterium]|nr:MBL fold metallo-hydrolase [Peptococcaceae bacterium]